LFSGLLAGQAMVNQHWRMLSNYTPDLIEMARKAYCDDFATFDYSVAQALC
jgi:hypothetical protein